jgi:phosphogluconate dehydratase
VPLLARVYPNGSADVNHFHAAGGMGFLMRELLDAGLLHERREDRHGAKACRLCAGALARRRRLAWRPVPAPAATLVLRPVASPSAPTAACACSGQPRPQRGQGLGRQARAPRGARPAVVLTTSRTCWRLFNAGELESD